MSKADGRACVAQLLGPLRGVFICWASLLIIVRRADLSRRQLLLLAITDLGSGDRLPQRALNLCRCLLLESMVGLLLCIRAAWRPVALTPSRLQRLRHDDRWVAVDSGRSGGQSDVERRYLLDAGMYVSVLDKADDEA